MSEIDDLANGIMEGVRVGFPSVVRDNTELIRDTRGPAPEYVETKSVVGMGTVFIDGAAAKDSSISSKSFGVKERKILMFNFTAVPEEGDCLRVPNLRDYIIEAVNDETGGERFFEVIASAARDRA